MERSKKPGVNNKFIGNSIQTSTGFFFFISEQRDFFLYNPQHLVIAKTITPRKLIFFENNSFLEVRKNIIPAFKNNLLFN